METVQPQARPARRGRVWLVALALGLGFSGLFVVGLVPRAHRQAELAAAAASTKSDLPVVTVAHAKQAPASTSLALPGEIKAFQEAAVFARSNGYLKRRLVDLGDHVGAGQLLAEIESPELDRELDSARAALAQAEANLEKAKSDYALAQTTAARWQALRKGGNVAQQDADEKAAASRSQGATVAAMTAGVSAARKNVQRLEALARYERVEAPFAGTISARGADPGTLVGAGGGAGALFHVVQLDRLRIDVSVPEPFAPTVASGQAVEVRVRELGHPYRGQVVRTAGALDPATRTLLAEIELANDGHLMPGMYATVAFEAARAVPVLQVPGTAVVTGANGSRVAVVKPDGTVAFHPVVTGTDDGTLVEIASGLAAGDAVVLGPSDAVRDGVRVQPVELKEP